MFLARHVHYNTSYVPWLDMYMIAHVMFLARHVHYSTNDVTDNTHSKRYSNCIEMLFFEANYNYTQ